MRGKSAFLLGIVLAALLAGGSIRAQEKPRSRLAVAPIGVIDAVPQGPSLEERLAEIRRRIQQAVVYPEEARLRGLSGLTLVGFEIDPGGHAVEIRTRSSSGYAILDDAAERAVVDAGALPRVLGRLEVPVGFVLED